MARRLGTRPDPAAPAVPMIRREVKLRLTKAQEQVLRQWRWHLTGVYNWAIRKIELDAKDGIYHSKIEFLNLLAGTSERLEIPSQVIQGTLAQAYDAWRRCFKKLAGKPHLRGVRRPLNSIHFPDRTAIPEPGVLKVRGFMDPIAGSPWAPIRYKRQRAQAKHSPARGDMIFALPAEALRGCRISERASGWYASIVVEMAPNPISRHGTDSVGIDAGFMTLLTLSTGEKIAHPQEARATAHRLAQAQRGRNRRLIGRLSEHLSNQVRDRNHKISRRLVADHGRICYSRDHLRGMARAGFGGSVRAAAHGQLRTMLETKCRTGGSEFVVVSPYKSTMTCCACGAETGPRGRAGLKVRQWVCAACGAAHDRDVNAAVHTRNVGDGQSLERVVRRDKSGARPPGTRRRSV